MQADGGYEMTKTLVIGGYTEIDTAAMMDTFDPVFLPDISELSSLPEDQRAAIKVAAYKGHAPFGADQMDQLPALGLIANFGVGYDAIAGKAVFLVRCQNQCHGRRPSSRSQSKTMPWPGVSGARAMPSSIFRGVST